MKRLRSGSKLGLIFGSGSKYNKMDPQHWQKCRTNIYKHFLKVFILVVYISWVESKPPSYFSSGSTTLRRKKKILFRLRWRSGNTGMLITAPVPWINFDSNTRKISWQAEHSDNLNVNTTTSSVAVDRLRVFFSPTPAPIKSRLWTIQNFKLHGYLLPD